MEHIQEQIFALPVLLGQVTYNPESKRLLVPLTDFLGMTVVISGFKRFPVWKNQNEENELLCFGQVVQVTETDHGSLSLGVWEMAS